MSPIVPIALLAVASVLSCGAFVADLQGRTNVAIAAGVTAAAAFVLMLASLPDVTWGNAPQYHPETCVDLTYSGGRWACVPREEAG